MELTNGQNFPYCHCDEQQGHELAGEEANSSLRVRTMHGDEVASFLVIPPLLTLIVIAMSMA
jgi:hypothetical protein